MSASTALAPMTLPCAVASRDGLPSATSTRNQSARSARLCVEPVGRPVYCVSLISTHRRWVEVVSKSNTAAEIARKIAEYFAAGTRLVWIVNPKTQSVRVNTSPRKAVTLGIDDVLDGGEVLPGLKIPVRDVFGLDD